MMSTARDKIEQMANIMPEEKLEQVADFMAYLLSKEDSPLHSDLTGASKSGLSFWDNAEDEVWDHV